MDRWSNTETATSTIRFTKKGEKEVGNLRTHMYFNANDGVIHSAKFKEENYDEHDYEPMDLNAVERAIIHEKRIADEEFSDQEWRSEREGSNATN